MAPNLGQLVNEITQFIATPLGNGSKNFVSWLAQRPLIANWGRREVYQCCLNRLPEFGVDGDQGYASTEQCAQHVSDCLVSYEFRSELITIIGSAMPWIPRTFFVHIPRTAGSSVKMTIEAEFRGLCWHADHLEEEWFVMDAHRSGLDPLMFMLRFLAQFANPAAELMVVGHVSLGALLARRFIRAGDRVFTVIRPPEQVIYSALNHIVDVVTGEADTPDALDWRNWMGELGVTWSRGEQLAPADLRRILGSTRFAEEYANPLTRYLSHDGTVEGAVAATSMVRCSVLTQRSVQAYLKDELGLAAPIGVYNQSRTQAQGLFEPSTVDMVRDSFCNLDLELFRFYDEQKACFVKGPEQGSGALKALHA